jgi:hypothetical protein
MKRATPTDHVANLDRREFIVAVGAVAVAYVPIESIVQAASAPANTPAVLLDDWTIDDMWGVYPRPSEPIGYGRPGGGGEVLAAIAPVDAPFCA